MVCVLQELHREVGTEIKNKNKNYEEKKEMKMIKKNLFLSVIAMALFMCFGVMNAQAAPYATLNLLDSDISVGDIFDVEVWMQGDNIGQELLAFGFDVNNPNALLAYSGYTLNTSFDDISLGANNVAGTAFPGITEDSVLLGTLHFTANAAGTGNLQVLGEYDNLFSGAFYEIDGFDINANQDINVNAVPIPGALYLLGSGIIGLLGFRRNRQL